MLMLRSAVRVSLLADQLMASFTWMSPLPPAVPMLVVMMVKLLLARALDTAAPVMLPPLAATVKSFGSISQSPVLPPAAAVVTRAAPMSTWLALVSIKPPLPPCGALASSTPATCNLPCCMSPSSTIWPASPVARVCASITPVLLMTLEASAPAALAVR